MLVYSPKSHYACAGPRSQAATKYEYHIFTLVSQPARRSLTFNTIDSMFCEKQGSEFAILLEYIIAGNFECCCHHFRFNVLSQVIWRVIH